jgi:RNA polymerase sigma-70 factor (ECF subfamily)
MPGETENNRDAELMHRAAAGDRAAFDELVVRHAPAMFRFARVITSNDSGAEDALQDAFLGAWRGAGTFRGDASVRNWLLTIVRNAVFRQHRRPVDQPEDMQSLSDLGVAAGWGDNEDPEVIALRRESRAVLMDAMDHLSASDREILLLREVESLPGKDVATILGLALPAMKTRLHRARLRLASRVKEAYEQTR